MLSEINAQAAKKLYVPSLQGEEDDHHHQHFSTTPTSQRKQSDAGADIFNDECITSVGPVIFRSTWTLWMAENILPAMSTYDYLARLTNIQDIKNSDDFNHVIDHITPPHILPYRYSYHVMKHDYLPLWEHPVHVNGGEYEFKCPKQYSTLAWVELMAGLLLDKFSHEIHPDDEILGLTINSKGNVDVIQIWNRYATLAHQSVLVQTIHDLLPRLQFSFYKVHANKIDDFAVVDI